QTLGVEGYQGVVQQKRGGLLRRQHHLADGQPDRQVQLVRCALAEKGGLSGEHPPSLLGGGGHVPLQQKHIILPSGELCKDFRGVFSQGGGEAALELGVGPVQDLLGQGDGVVLPLKVLPAAGGLLRLRLDL